MSFLLVPGHLIDVYVHPAQWIVITDQEFSDTTQVAMLLLFLSDWYPIRQKTSNNDITI